MKSLLILTGHVVFAVTSLAGVLIVAADIAGSEPKPKRVESVYAAGLWTREPTVVNRGAQTLERVPSEVKYDAVAQRKTPRSLAGSMEVASIDPAFPGGLGLPERETAENVSSDRPVNAALAGHRQWCAEHYRSYRPSDDSYRAFSGARRVCQSPYSLAQGDAQGNPQGNAQARPPKQEALAYAGTTAPASSHVQSCMRRYRSYDVGSNTYQPFDGGPRKTCR